ncbi:hypothetical protein QNJ24_04110 [Macrococcus caseolyticus]|nr:hypothetical protein [Macrococcus caseolyticus]MDJ1155277.1 hypothetical protein [Macrococcus caseolyticus]
MPTVQKVTQRKGLIGKNIMILRMKKKPNNHQRKHMIVKPVLKKIQ